MSDTPPGDTSAKIDEDEGHEWTGPRLRRGLLTAVVVGAVLWFLGAVVFFGSVVGIGSANPGRWVVWLQAGQYIGEALCVGSAATLIGLFVVDRWGGTSR
jgi:hypothetical protein